MKSGYIDRLVVTLRYWRCLGTGPRSYRLGRHTFYDIADLDAWVAAEAAKTERGGLAR